MRFKNQEIKINGGQARLTHAHKTLLQDYGSPFLGVRYTGGERF